MHVSRRHAAVAAALGGTLGVGMIAGVAIGINITGSSASDPDPTKPDSDPQYVALAGGELRAPEDCDDLLAWYVDLGEDRVGPYGWGGGPVIYDEGGPVPTDAPDASEDGGATSPDSGSDPDKGQGSSDTGTNVQEIGVDEPDVVKTNGDILARIEDEDTLTVWDVTGAEPVRTGSLELDDLAEPELLLVGDRVFAIGGDAESEPDYDEYYYGDYAGGLGGRMVAVDLSDPTSPEVLQTTTYDAPIEAARQHGDVVRLQFASDLPDLDFVEPGVFRDEESALERNRKIVAQSELGDWLPHVSVDGGEQRQLVGCEDVAVPQDDDAGLGTLTLAGFDGTGDLDPQTWSTTGVATESTITYASEHSLYLADPGTSWSSWDSSGDYGSTRLYQFDLSGTEATFSAAGEVDGRVMDRWSMDSVDGGLRVAVNPTEETGDFNSVVTFEQTGDTLTESGRVDHLGPGEEIQSVRWYDDLAIVVTFRQTDPFYVVGLADPRDPKLLGELKIPGFSSYLHPIGDDRLIGVGAHGTADGLTGRAQAALFDISDLTDPARLSTIKYRAGSIAGAGTDPRQFTWLGDEQTALTVITDNRTGLVSVLKVDGDRLVKRNVEVDYGSDVADIRTVPLPDGRVLLVTGSDVQAFDLT